MTYHGDGRIGIQGADALAQELADAPVFDDWDVSSVGAAGLRPEYANERASFQADDSEWVYEVTVRRVRRAEPENAEFASFERLGERMAAGPDTYYDQP